MNDLNAKCAREAVVVFAKSPVAGNVKTRLTPELSKHQAADLYQAFLDDTAMTVGRFAADSKDPMQCVLAYSGEYSGAFAEFDRQGFSKIDQGDGDLGQRLKGVCESCSKEGIERVVIVGTDSPTLDIEHLRLGFSLLELNDVVFGPSFDGGYYLIGIRLGGVEARVPPQYVVFDNISWSSSDVMHQSWSRCRGASLLCELMGFWYDVDTFEDLKMLRFHLCEYLRHKDQGYATEMKTFKYLQKLESQGVFARA